MSRRQFLRGAAVLSFALGLRGSAPPCEPKFSGKSVPPPPSGIPSPTESAPPPESTPPPDLETLLKKDVISDEEIEVLARSAVDIFCGSLGCKAADSPDLYRYYGTPITSRSHDLSSHDIYVEVDVIKLPEERGNEAVRVGGANTYLTLAEQAPRQAQAAFIASLVKFLGSDAHQPLEADPPSLEMIDRYFNSASGPVKIEPFGLTGFVIGAELVQEDSQNRPLLMFDAGFDLVVRLYLAIWLKR